MLFSCKLTVNLLHFLDQNHVDYSDLEEIFEPSFRDSNSWIECEELEKILRAIVKLDHSFNGEQIFVEAARTASHHRNWGVFDSVLRVMPGVKALYSQPQKLLSHFVSPEPEIEDLRWGEDSVSFVLRDSLQDFPVSKFYLQNLIEVLPLFSGKPLSHCEWSQNQIKISWSQAQAGFENLEVLPSISPQLIQDLVLGLENKAFSQSKEISQGELQTIKAHVSTLADSFSRAQQVIALFMSQSLAEKKNSAKMEQALVKIEWERVQKRFPEVFEALQKALNRLES